VENHPVRPNVLLAVLPLLGLGLGVLVGRVSVDAPSPAFVQALEQDNDRLRAEVGRLGGECVPGVGALGVTRSEAEAALDKLRTGGLSSAATLELLEKISPEQAASLELDSVLGPILESEGYKVVRVLGRLAPSPATLARLDARVIKGAATGSTTQAVLSHYLRYTGRLAWADIRPLVETGLEKSSTETRGVFLLTAIELEDGPDEAWVEWAQKHYAFSDPVRVMLQRRTPR
jgi:hypothetical protein